MRIAFHIALHDKSYQFAWLAEAIASPDDYYLIHVDRRAGDLDRAVKAIMPPSERVGYQPRHSLIYSEWELCEIQLEAMRMLLDRHRDWDYFVNLSGQCYPLRALEAIRAYLAENPSRNFVDMIPFDALPAYFRRRKEWVALRVGNRLVRLPIPLPLPADLRVDWHGSAWHILSRPFCEWMVGDPLAQRLFRWLHYVKMPNEMFVQAALAASPFSSTRCDYRRLIVWRRRQPHPEVLTREHDPLIETSGALFGRKFDARVDEEVLHRLRRRVLPKVLQ